MKKTNHSELIFASKDLVEEIYKGNIDLINRAKVDPNDLDYMSYCEFVADNNLEDWPLPEPYYGEVRTRTEFDEYMQGRWYLPQEYKNFNIEEYLYSLCIDDIERSRIAEELELFKQHNMLPLLRFLKYLVDQMRENKILWGVGRGSSVASYALYLLGIHKINSIKYELDIREFLR